MRNEKPANESERLNKYFRAAITKITAYLGESWYTAEIEKLVYH